MATTTTTLTPGAKNVPYIGPIPTQDLWNTIIPRGEILFVILGGAVAEAAAGRDQQFVVNAILPAGFAYSMRDFSVYIEDAETGDTNDWDDQAQLFIRDSVTSDATSTWSYGIGASKPVTALTVTSTLKGANYTPNQDPLGKLIIPGAAGGLVQFSTWNLTIDGGPLYVNYFLRLLTFDLNQAYRAIVNTPVPVR